MPTYHYECKKCGYIFKEFQNIKDAPLRICIKCKGPVYRLVSTGGGVIFKGKGFYQTDYKTSNKSDSPKGESKPGPCGGSCDCPCKS